MHINFTPTEWPIIYHPLLKDWLPQYWIGRTPLSENHLICLGYIRDGLFCCVKD